jgi:hypothetical protein
MEDIAIASLLMSPRKSIFCIAVDIEKARSEFIIAQILSESFL